MPKLTLTIFEPIEIVLGDKTYKIESLSSDMMDRFMKAAKNVGSDPETMKIAELGSILAEVLPGMTREAAAQVDIRYVIKIAEFLAAQIEGAGKPGEVKN